MGTNNVVVEVRLGKYDCVHLAESQACIHIEHPQLAEPLNLILSDYHAEEFQNSFWDEIVARALNIWLAHTWLSSDRARVASFKDLFDGSKDVRDHFRRACAEERLCQCRSEMERLQREMAGLQDYLAEPEVPAKKEVSPKAA